ncbi:hypothetical protein HK105_203473 [Polyrhizophydium stewartii]|uniref:Uncharacterized protein n=1 Tax=Polyrhizophydium stewartii TaxID=2732419 RepID=A0ABR4NC74_9FUNG
MSWRGGTNGRGLPLALDPPDAHVPRARARATQAPDPPVSPPPATEAAETPESAAGAAGSAGAAGDVALAAGVAGSVSAAAASADPERAVPAPPAGAAAAGRGSRNGGNDDSGDGDDDGDDDAAADAADESTPLLFVAAAGSSGPHDVTAGGARVPVLTADGFPDDPPPYYNSDTDSNAEPLPTYAQVVQSSDDDDADWVERCGSCVMSSFFLLLLFGAVFLTLLPLAWDDVPMHMPERPPSIPTRTLVAELALEPTATRAADLPGHTGGWHDHKHRQQRHAQQQRPHTPTADGAAAPAQVDMPASASSYKIAATAAPAKAAAGSPATPPPEPEPLSPHHAPLPLRGPQQPHSPGRQHQKLLQQNHATEQHRPLPQQQQHQQHQPPQHRESPPTQSLEEEEHGDVQAARLRVPRLRRPPPQSVPDRVPA